MVRDLLITQAIDNARELNAKYICNAKFEKLSYQWEAMYGTAVGHWQWENAPEKSYNQTTTL